MAIAKVVPARQKHSPDTAKILVEAYYKSIDSARKAVRDAIKKKECFVALHDKSVVGVLIYTRNYSHHANYIEDIAVSRAERGKGVATELLRKYIITSMKETPKKQKYALSSTDATNKASINMHLKFGFKEIGRIKGLHYGRD